MVVRYAFSLLLVLFALPAIAQTSTVSGTTTFTTIYGTPFDIAGTDTTGKVVSPVFYDPEVPTVILAFVGQSFWNNNIPGNYVAVNSAKMLNFNPYDGKMYLDGVRPLGPLGAVPSGGCTNPDGSDCRDNLARYVVDQVLSLTNPDGSPKFLRAIYCIFSVGGSRADQWAPNGIYAPQIRDALNVMISKGLKPTAVLWDNGVADNDYGTTQAAYFASMSSVIQTARDNGLPFDVPWFIATETWSTTLGVSPAIQAAQAALVNPANRVYAGANIDTLGVGYRILPWPHLTAAGAAIAGGLWSNALQAYGAPF